MPRTVRKRPRQEESIPPEYQNKIEAVRPEVDLLSLQCAEILNMPGWHWYSLRAVEPDGRQINGAVCKVLVRSGPRKGRPNWNKSELGTDKELFLPMSVIAAWEEEWSKKTGLCKHCTGSGRRCVGVHFKWGSRYKVCPNCSGSGNRSKEKKDAEETY